MSASASTADRIAEYRRYFDSIYIAGIPRLLNDDGAFLSFITVVTGTEALAGLYAPSKQNGDRFRDFVLRYYPAELRAYAEKLWELRNAVVHCFHPGPFALTHHASWAHLRSQDGTIVLNAEDFYAALLVASQRYFSELENSEELQAAFLKRTSSAGGGAMQVLAAQPAPILPRNASLERTRER
jgi:hypothetical protein